MIYGYIRVSTDGQSVENQKLNRYHKSAVPKLPKKRGGKAMKRYDENFKIEALKLSDEIGVKKACEQLNVNYGRFILSGTNGTA